MELVGLNVRMKVHSKCQRHKILIFEDTTIKFLNIILILDLLNTQNQNSLLLKRALQIKLFRSIIIEFHSVSTEHGNQKHRASNFEGNLTAVLWGRNNTPENKFINFFVSTF